MILAQTERRTQRQLVSLPNRLANFFRINLITPSALVCLSLPLCLSVSLYSVSATMFTRIYLFLSHSVTLYSSYVRCLYVFLFLLPLSRRRLFFSSIFFCSSFFFPRFLSFFISLPFAFFLCLSHCLSLLC